MKHKEETLIKLGSTMGCPWCALLNTQTHTRTALVCGGRNRVGEDVRRHPSLDMGGTGLFGEIGRCGTTMRPEAHWCFTSTKVTEMGWTMERLRRIQQSFLFIVIPIL